MQALLSLAIALGPVYFVLRFVDRYDRRPEPRALVARALFYGALSTAPAIALGFGFNLLLTGAPLWSRTAIEAFLQAGLVEESVKLGALSLIATHRDFDEPMDGILYGVATALGFAGLENLLYVFGGHGGLARAFTAVPGHAMDGALVGAALAIDRFERPRVKLLPWMFCLVVLMHGAYDFPMMIAHNGLETHAVWSETALHWTLGLSVVPGIVLWAQWKMTRGLLDRFAADQETRVAADAGRPLVPGWDAMVDRFLRDLGPGVVRTLANLLTGFYIVCAMGAALVGLFMLSVGGNEGRWLGTLFLGQGPVLLMVGFVVKALGNATLRRG